MKILHLEDDVFKRKKIERILCSAGADHSVWVKNLEDGIICIEEAQNKSEPYDLIISDMYYPLKDGGRETEAGTMLLSILKDKGIDTPVIICSSARLRIPEAYECLWYSENSNWDRQLESLLRKIQEK
ncbi:response regulator [Frisingicoccus sp.]|uniref:response regulator n=1 Tax=Frisingicoccus sp. TaxID=1918627 RepID=UPI003AB3008E